MAACPASTPMAERAEPPTEQRAEAAYAEFRRTRRPRAMAEVFDLVAGELLVLARRLARDAASAEDLVQQTFVRAIERADQFDPSRRLLPWLTTILANEARMAHRRGEPDVTRVRVPAVVEPPQAVAEREARAAMDAAFAELPAECRDVVAMRHLHGMPPRQIAAALGVPVATVKTRLRRGVERLAAMLPPGLAFGAAVSLVAGRGLAATRGAVLARAGGIGTATAALSFGGVLAMKKFAFVLVAALVLIVSRPHWWNAEPTVVDAAGEHAAARVTSAATIANPVATPEGATRSPVAGSAGSAATAEPADLVPIDIAVAAVWKQSKKPAARVPLVLLVQPNDRLANTWTDDGGKAHFVLRAAPRHWLAGTGDRSVSVSTPLWPGRYFNLVLTAEPGTLEVELDDGEPIAGLVVDAAGNPVPGADVRLGTWPNSETVVTRTDAAGTFALQGLPAEFVLRASAGAMESAPANIASLAGGERLVLRLDRGGDLVRVHVVAGTAAVADATVRLDTGWRISPPQRQALGQTDSSGFVTFAGLPADSYVVEVVHRAHPPAQRRITTAGLGVPRTETVELGESATLVGMVRRGGNPAATIRVMFEGADSLFYRREIATDRDGRFVMERLAVGQHTLLFAATTAWVSRPVTLRAGEQVVAFDLPGGPDIVGRLLMPDGSPAVRWNVVAQRADEFGWSSKVAATDAEGRFRCGELPAMSYRLIATGAEGGGHTFFIAHSSATSADYRLPAAALWQPARITGRIEGAPANATLMTAADPGNVGSGAQLGGDGTIALGPLAPGRRRLWLDRDGEVLWLTEVELTSGQALDLGVISLARHGALAVTVRSAPGIDAASAQVSLRAAVASDGESFGPRLRLGADGAWHCGRVPAGEWWLTVVSEGSAPDVRKLVVEPGTTRRIDVVLASAVAVEVHYAVAEGDAKSVGWRRETVRRVSDRAIVCYRGLSGPLRTRLDLAPGSYTIEVETGGCFRGVATFDVPAPATVAVPLMRR
jgi:RNA polymerase sigma factor (sigma-70 family)